MHELWLQAGGGTPNYDPDRYVGLLRDHGWTKERKGLGAILFDVLPIAAEKAGIPGFDDGTCDDLAGAMAPILTDELGKHGYRIHDIARCVRVGDPHVTGRPMSPDEEAAVGIQPGPRANQEASNPAPGAVASPSEGPREPGTGPSTFEHTTPEGDLFQVPDGWQPGEKSSRCRSCDALILWCTTPRGKRAPTNPDGSSHFSDCPDSAAWKRK